MVKQFYGLSIAVKDLDAAIKKYSTVLGVTPVPSDPSHFAYPDMKGASFRLGEITIQLIASDNPDTSVSKFVERRGEGVFLISLLVDNLEKEMQELTAKEVRLVSDKALPYASGIVNFAHPKSMHGVQVEFIQLNK